MIVLNDNKRKTKNVNATSMCLCVLFENADTRNCFIFIRYPPFARVAMATPPNKREEVWSVNTEHARSHQVVWRPWRRKQKTKLYEFMRIIRQTLSANISTTHTVRPPNTHTHNLMPEKKNDRKRARRSGGGEKKSFIVSSWMFRRMCAPAWATRHNMWFASTYIANNKVNSATSNRSRSTTIKRTHGSDKRRQPRPRICALRRIASLWLPPRIFKWDFYAEKFK